MNNNLLKNYEHNLEVFRNYEHKYGVYFVLEQRNYFAERFAGLKIKGIATKDVLPRLKGNCYYKMIAYFEDKNGIIWETPFDIEIDEKMTTAVENSKLN